jgi:hypothetical protein
MSVGKYDETHDPAQHGPSPLPLTTSPTSGVMVPSVVSKDVLGDNGFAASAVPEEKISPKASSFNNFITYPHQCVMPAQDASMFLTADVSENL